MFLLAFKNISVCCLDFWFKQHFWAKIHQLYKQTSMSEIPVWTFGEYIHRYIRFYDFFWNESQIAFWACDLKAFQFLPDCKNNIPDHKVTNKKRDDVIWVRHCTYVLTLLWRDSRVRGKIEKASACRKDSSRQRFIPPSQLCNRTPLFLRSPDHIT